MRTFHSPLAEFLMNICATSPTYDSCVAVGDLVFATIDSIDTYRIVDEIKANRLGQVGYRFGSQWYFGNYVSRVLRIGDIRTLRTFYPHRGDWNLQTVRIYNFFLTYNLRVAAVGTERWDDHLRRWYSAGYVAYSDLSQENWRSHIQTSSSSALAPFAAMQEVACG